VRSLEAIRCGKKNGDKLKIFVNRILHASYPLSLASYRALHKPLFEPRNLVSGYKCKYGEAVFACPGGNSELQFLNSFEPNVKRVISKFGDGDAVDVGANFGLHTIMMSKSRSDKSKILAIEPDRSYYRCLAENIALNKCRNVTALNIAAWSSTSKLAMRRHMFGGPMKDSVGEHTANGIDARPLDQVFLDYDIKPRVVKIDVEGAEYEVLLGMERTLRATRPSVIFEALNRQALARCNSLLEVSGYSISRLPDGNFLALP